MQPPSFDYTFTISIFTGDAVAAVCCVRSHVLATMANENSLAEKVGGRGSVELIEEFCRAVC